MEPPAVITQQLQVRCLAPVRGVRRAELRYDPADPYSVWVSLPGGLDDLPWEVARATLVQGISGVAGAGDVRVWPIVNDAGRSLVVLHLRGPREELVVELLTTQLHRFLGRTLGVVPLGTEGTRLDLDSVVEQLLAPENR